MTRNEASSVVREWSSYYAPHVINPVRGKALVDFLTRRGMSSRRDDIIETVIAKCKWPPTVAEIIDHCMDYLKKEGDPEEQALRDPASPIRCWLCKDTGWVVVKRLRESPLGTHAYHEAARCSCSS